MYIVYPGTLYIILLLALSQSVCVCNSCNIFIFLLSLFPSTFCECPSCSSFNIILLSFKIDSGSGKVSL